MWGIVYLFEQLHAEVVHLYENVNMSGNDLHFFDLFACSLSERDIKLDPRLTSHNIFIDNTMLSLISRFRNY